MTKLESEENSVIAENMLKYENYKEQNGRLKKALDNNWEGYEKLRACIIKRGRACGGDFGAGVAYEYASKERSQYALRRYCS